MNFTVGKNSKDWGEREERELKIWQETCFEIQSGPWQTFLLHGSDPQTPVENKNRRSQAKKLLPGHLVCSVGGEAHSRGPSWLYVHIGADSGGIRCGLIELRVVTGCPQTPSRSRSGPEFPNQTGFLLFHNGQVGRLWTATDGGEGALAKLRSWPWGVDSLEGAAAAPAHLVRTWKRWRGYGGPKEENEEHCCSVTLICSSHQAAGIPKAFQKLETQYTIS